MANPPQMSRGQRAYEEKRAAKAGMTLDKWLAEKERQAKAEKAAAAPAKPKPDKKPGFFARMLERARRPISK